MIKVLSLMVLLAGFSSETLAHVLRIAQLHIEETAPGQYQMRYTVPSGEEAIYPRPELPARCNWQEQASGSQSTGLIKLAFNCPDGALTASDQLALTWQRSGVMASMVWYSGVSARQFFPVEKSGISVAFSDLQAGSGSVSQTAIRYGKLGIHHILIGIDHLFFVVAMLLLVSQRIKLIAAITAFTLAHSLTLALSIFDVLRLNMAIVEVLITLSIVLMAKEAVLAQRGVYGLAWRYPSMIALAFGLVHGLGFADALMSLGIANESLVPTLVFFNLGIEAGQLIFIAAIFLLIALLKKVGLTFGAKQTLAVAYVLGVTAMIWFLTRLSFVL